MSGIISLLYLAGSVIFYFIKNAQSTANDPRTILKNEDTENGQVASSGSGDVVTARLNDLLRQQSAEAPRSGLRAG